MFKQVQAKSLGRMPNKGEIFQKCHLRKGTQTFVDKRSSDSYVSTTAFIM